MRDNPRGPGLGRRRRRGCGDRSERVLDADLRATGVTHDLTWRANRKGVLYREDRDVVIAEVLEVEEIISNPNSRGKDSVGRICIAFVARFNK